MGGVGVIKVGGASEVEVSEVKDRVNDALCATKAAVISYTQSIFADQRGAGCLRQAVELFDEIQPEISGHTNFVMARNSLSSAVSAVTELLDE